MKKENMMRVATSFLAIGVLLTLLIAGTAGATEPPVVDDIVSPIDAGKYTLSGTAEPGAKITITGGPYELSPIYADETTGAWEKTVTLTQDTENNFSITAFGEDEVTSEAVQIVIVESASEAQTYEETYGEDRTAPDAPSVDTPESPVDSGTATITGTAEADATIVVSGGDDIQGEADSSGNFSIVIILPQNETTNFYFAAQDSAGNTSSTTKITITEEGPELDVEEDEEEEEAAEELEINFSDVSGHWAEDYIMSLATDEVISGYDDGTFGPDNNITRAEITKIALGAFEYDVYGADAVFSDVDGEAWYADYVNSAADYDILSGYDDGTFKPGDNINRAEALKILLGASEVADMAGSSVFLGDEDSWENSFSDVSSVDWFYEYVMQASTAEVVAGYVDGTFGPANNITRAEVSKVVQNLIDLKAEILATPTI